MYRADAMSDAQLAGQRLVVGFEGKIASADLRSLISQFHVGGLILFKRNISDPPQLAELCRGAQRFASEEGVPPLIICVDQEGGPVARLGPPFSVFPGNRAIGESESVADAKQFGRVTARELAAVGVNVNLAPVLDVVPNGLESPVMADRVFGSSPGLVASLGKSVIESLQENGVAATAKHFPGIGRSVVDSHLDLPFLDTKRDVLEGTDWVPFKEAIAAGVEAVMLSHVVYRDLDPLWPAGLSSAIAKELLRETMGFKGVIFTDDLDMGAIDKHYDVVTCVHRICEAEIDIVLICHDRQKIKATHEALLAEMDGSQEVRTKSVASVQRILNLKKKYAL